MTVEEMQAIDIHKSTCGREREELIVLFLREIAIKLAKLVDVSMEAENLSRPG